MEEMRYWWEWRQLLLHLNGSKVTVLRGREEGAIELWVKEFGVDY